MTYRLWGRPGWGSAIVEAQLAWYGLPFEVEPVDDLFKNPEAAARLRKVNPLAQVPTLEMPDGTVMSESAAITLLLADITGSDSLVPRAGAPERARFLQEITERPAAFYDMLGKVNTAKSECSRDSDRERIFAAVRELDGGVDGGRVWMACDCGAHIAHPVEPPAPACPDRVN